MANEFNPDLLEDAAADVVEILRENDTPTERREAFVSFAEGVAVAGVLSAGQAVGAILGLGFNPKLWAATAGTAFVTGCVRYVREWRSNRKNKK